MIDRRALLIASPESGYTPVYGTLADLAGWRSHLRSPTGGAWMPSEIRELVDPSPHAFRSAMTWANGADLACVFVGAHGYTHTDVFGVVHERVVVGREFHPTVSELIPWNARWGMTLIDACRDFRGTVSVSESGEKVAGLGEIGDPMQTHQHRQYFDALVSKVRPKQELGLSCAFNESATEDSSYGGYFSIGVRQVADLSPSSVPGARFGKSFRTCVNESATLVTRATGGDQHPQFRQTTNVGMGLPFAVAVTPAPYRYW